MITDPAPSPMRFPTVLAAVLVVFLCVPTSSAAQGIVLRAHGGLTGHLDRTSNQDNVAPQIRQQQEFLSVHDLYEGLTGRIGGSAGYEFLRSGNLFRVGVAYTRHSVSADVDGAGAAYGETLTMNDVHAYGEFVFNEGDVSPLVHLGLGLRQYQGDGRVELSNPQLSSPIEADATYNYEPSFLVMIGFGVEGRVQPESPVRVGARGWVEYATARLSDVEVVDDAGTSATLDADADTMYDPGLGLSVYLSYTFPL
jgi:hypothetical protein